jgi:heme oxygenase
MALSLGEEINAATRSDFHNSYPKETKLTFLRPLHTTLNRFILSFLPLSLPPHTLSPHLYAHGISPILPIYSAFESSLNHALSSSTTPPRTRNILFHLHIPALERTQRLTSDLALLNPSHSPTPPPPHTNPSSPPNLRSFLHHISNSTSQKPYLIIAYTHLLYLALFSGGRYLRSQLRVANTQSWRLGPSPDLDPDAPLQFWCFDGDEDGEDLKAEFKARVKGLEGELTSEKRREIVQEGVEIMRRMVGVVEEIAAGVETSQVEDEGAMMTTAAATVTPQMTAGFLLLLSVVKMLGIWSWGFASGFDVGLGVVRRGFAA